MVRILVPLWLPAATKTRRCGRLLLAARTPLPIWLAERSPGGRRVRRPAEWATAWRAVGRGESARSRLPRLGPAW